ncbi:MAG TPA: protein translocase subunit SecF [Acidobacteriaceae bacterium]|nr:protein translocase subunit SecF [Acidobacteriaceae bacterium]
MELFHNPSIDWLGKKWYFLGFSLIFSVAGLLSIFFWHGLPLDVDFRGGTVVRVKFAEKPNVDRIRAAANEGGLKDPRITTYGPAGNDEVLVTLSRGATNESALDQGRAAIVAALSEHYASSSAQSQGRIDLDNASREALTSWLLQKDPEHLGSAPDAQTRYEAQANAVAQYRDSGHSGIIDSIGNLGGAVDPAVLTALQDGAYLSGFSVRSVEIVGAQVGKQLQHQAELATLYSLGGMLVYLWFRFELIYGVAAVVACFHDTLITVGAFSLKDMEISLTVIAAILTLIGYSMNDTIVVFDRIRENLRLSRREKLSDLVNRSINQTLSRTVLTSGLTFLTVLSLFVFGGQVLHPFSFALVVGILIGTYSSIAVAAPMLVAYQDWRARRGKTAALPAAKKARV